MRKVGIFGLAAVIFAFAATGAFATEKHGAVLAKVGDVEITQAEVDQILKELPPQQAAMFRTPAGKEKVVEELVNRELLLLWGTKEKVENNEGFAKDLERLKKDLIRDYAAREIIAKVSVSDEDVKKFYDENKDRFTTPEKVEAMHILVKTEDEANAIIGEIKKGKDFSEAAKEHSTGPSKDNGGKLPAFGKGEMVKPFEDAAFALEEGAMTEKPVKTQFGWHIIKVEKKVPSSVAPLKDVEENIRGMLTQKEQQNAFYSKLEELKKEFPVEIMKQKDSEEKEAKEGEKTTAE